MPFAGQNVPDSNWLACSGAAVSRITYAKLFAYIGTLYGPGDGNETFNLPDLNNKGAFIRGNGGSASPIGTLQAEAVGPHTHPITDPEHQHHTVTYDSGPYNAAFGSSGNFTYVFSHVGAFTGAAAWTDKQPTGITVDKNTGSETRPVNYSMLYCIRAL